MTQVQYAKKKKKRLKRFVRHQSDRFSEFQKAGGSHEVSMDVFVVGFEIIFQCLTLATVRKKLTVIRQEKRANTPSLYEICKILNVSRTKGTFMTSILAGR